MVATSTKSFNKLFRGDGRRTATSIYKQLGKSRYKSVQCSGFGWLKFGIACCFTGGGCALVLLPTVGTSFQKARSAEKYVFSNTVRLSAYQCDSIPLPTSPAEPKLNNEKTRGHRAPRDITRLGSTTLQILSITSLVILGVTGFLTFLWFGHHTNKTWDEIMIRNWATRAMSVSALLVRTAVDFQASIASAILVSLLLESRAGIHLYYMAILSPMRTGAASHGVLLDSCFKNLAVVHDLQAERYLDTHRHLPSWYY